MKPLCKGPVVIIGGGPAGLGGAYHLNRQGFDDWLLVEREDTVGGLASSFEDEHGFTWDLGGHVVFSHYGLFTRMLDELWHDDGWIKHQRESWIKLNGCWVPYPFQNNIHRLGLKDCTRCLEGLIAAAVNNNNHTAKNFEDFIVRTFGAGIAELFLLPYNYKVWAYRPSKLDVSWVGERVSVPDPVRVTRNALLKSDDVAWGPNNRFRFPSRGGTGAIWKALAKVLPKEKVMTQLGVVDIDVESRRLTLSDGSRIGYGAIISTMPLDKLTELCHKKDWIAQASGLIHSSAFIVGVALKDKPPNCLDKKCWMYFPDDSTPFYRATHFSLYSPRNVNDISKHWSLMLEVSQSPDKHVDESKVVDECIQGLLNTGLIEDKDQVHHTWMKRVEYAYPTPFIGRDEIINTLLPQLSEQSILSRGRFGAWKYEVGNMDHSFMQGYEAAGQLVNGSAELTLWYPNMVNQPHPVVGWDRVA